jgi:hypothetical protein
LFETLHDDPNCDEIIAHEMGWDRPEPGEEDDEDAFDALREMEAAAAELSEEEIREIARRDRQELRAIPAYKRGFAYGLKVHNALKKYLEAVDGDPGEDVSIAHLNSMIIAAKIAGGHGMGYEDHALCGNIVCCKRALEAANKCLEAMKTLKERGTVPAKTLDPLITEGEEIRRLVEVRIAELRKRVWWA